MPNKKVMVTGCFDLLHSGHVAFLQQAATYGDLYVCIGNRKNVMALKARPEVQSDAERQYMLNALRCVKECIISSGQGMLDYTAELDAFAPDIFIVNEDGHSAEKEALCTQRGIEYIVLQRIPAPGLPARSTTELRKDTGYQLPDTGRCV